MENVDFLGCLPYNVSGFLGKFPYFAIILQGLQVRVNNMIDREHFKALHRNKIWQERALLMCVADILAIIGSYFLALLLRYDFTFSAIDPLFIEGFRKIIFPWCGVTIVVFYLCHLYHSIWSLASAK